MSTFLRDLLGTFRWGNLTNNPFKILEVRPDDYVHCDVHCREDSLVVYGYRDKEKYEVVLHIDIAHALNMAYSLLRTEESSDAQVAFIQLKDKLPVLVECVPNITKDLLQDVTSIIKENPSWSIAHIASHFGLLDCFKHNAVLSHLNDQCADGFLTPIHVAVKATQVGSVQILLHLDVRLDIVDTNGNTPFHYAANTSKEVIQALTAQPPYAVINMFNNDGYTPLHLACLEDKPECVKELLRSGADVNVASIDASNCAAIASHSHCAKDVIDTFRTQLYPQDMKFGGTPLHWAKSPQVLEALLELGCNLDARNFQGDTALHVMVTRNRMSCVVTLLSHGANADLPGADGNTPLHLAVKCGDLSLVHTFIAFGCDINASNSKGETPRHIAATEKKEIFKDILFALHAVQASRCSKKSPTCTEGCSPDGTFDGNYPEKNPLESQLKFYDGLIGAIAVSAALAKKERQIASRAKFKTTTGHDSINSSPDFCRVLCLDGGGIRGLVTIQVLWELENVIGQPMCQCFDWVAGTSTGGILALALALGKSVHEIRCLYFRLKDKVFVGNRPYDAEELEKFLQNEMGENTVMSSIDRLRVMVTGVMTDRQPADLHLFRNYDSPQDIIQMSEDAGKENEQSPFQPPPKPSEQLVWKAARASGAAPTYFRASGSFVDGGLMANNPTLDTLTEIHQYNMALKATGQKHLKQNIGVVVSLGTGKPPVVQVNAIDLFRPDTLLGAAKIALGVSVLGQLLVDQATQTDGRVVERAQAWCSMINVPYFRINPPLMQNIALDETDTKVLVKLLWETSVYMRSKRDDVEKLATLIR